MTDPPELGDPLTPAPSPRLAASVGARPPAPVASPPSEPPEPSGAPALRDPDLYFNRELSWLDFNHRVLQLAQDPSVALLERVKFCAIYANNLDEFFMVRVAGLHDQVDAGVQAPGADGRTPFATIEQIRERVLDLDAQLTSCLEGDLLSDLAEHGIELCHVADIDEDDRQFLCERFRREIFPALTPLAVGPGRPFPYISNLSLSLAVLVGDPSSGHTAFARVKVPKEILPRFLALRQRNRFVPLEDVIADNLDALFPGMEIVDFNFFRVTRDADLTVSDEADDLLQAVEDQLRRRRFGEVVRLELGARTSQPLHRELTRALGVEPYDVYPVSGLLDLQDLWQLVKLPGLADLRDPPWTAVTHPRFGGDDEGRADVMGAMLRLGLPVSATFAVETGLFFAIGLLIGLEGPIPLAAQQVALSIVSVSFMIPLAIAQAANVRVGHRIGAGDAPNARRAGLVAIGLGGAFEGASALLLLVVPATIIDLYLDPALPGNGATFAIALGLLKVAIVFQVADGVQSVASGALRGLGDTRVPFLLATVGYWGVGFPAAWLLTMWAGWGAAGAWWGLAASLIVVAVLLTRRFLQRSSLRPAYAPPP